jgi:hypothetical protein
LLREFWETISFPQIGDKIKSSAIEDLILSREFWEKISFPQIGYKVKSVFYRGRHTIGCWLLQLDNWCSLDNSILSFMSSY